MPVVNQNISIDLPIQARNGEFMLSFILFVLMRNSEKPERINEGPPIESVFGKDNLLGLQ